MNLAWWKKRVPFGRAEAPTKQDTKVFDASFQAKLDTLAIAARRMHASDLRAQRRSKRVGSGIEFADHRDYAPGDDFRRIDWNVYVRTGRMLLRLFEEEADVPVFVLLDASASMNVGSPPKLVRGKQIAAALTYVASSNLDRTSLVVLREAGATSLPVARGRGVVVRVLRELERLEGGGTTNLAAACERFVRSQPRRGVVLLISDFFDAGSLSRAIDVLRHARFEVHTIQLVDSKELELAGAGDVVLEDVETGELREVSLTSNALAQIRASYAAHREELRTLALDKHIAHHEVDVQLSFDEAVLGILRRERVFE